MNDIQDKQYLALELTKLTVANYNDFVCNEKIMENYYYILNDLTGVMDKIEKLQELEKEIEKLQGLLKIATDNLNHGKKLHRLIDVINQCKGDMEPYVYECLMAEINMKM